MGLNPQVQALLSRLAATDLPALNTLPVSTAREAAAALGGMSAPPEPVADVTNRIIAGPGGALPLRIYRPAGPPPFPTLVYFHGGGWVIGNLDTHDGICRALANAASCVVVSVDYRLAPEHRFPAATEDAYAATSWVAAHAASIGGTSAALAVGGDSAGANLAAVVALMGRDRGGPPLRFQMLVYPVTDASLATASYRENADGYLLTRDLMRWFWDLYVPDAIDRENAYAAPLRAADLSALPSALVMTAEFDPLRDEGEAYAKRLRAAGVPVTLSRYDGMIHGFFGMTGMIDRARMAIEEAANALRSACAL